MKPNPLQYLSVLTGEVVDMLKPEYSFIGEEAASSLAALQSFDPDDKLLEAVTARIAALDLPLPVSDLSHFENKSFAVPKCFSSKWSTP